MWAGLQIEVAPLCIFTVSVSSFLRLLLTWLPSLSFSFSLALCLSISLLLLPLPPSPLSLMEMAAVWSLPAAASSAPHIFFMVFIAENWATALFDMKHDVLICYLLSPWQPCDQWCWLPATYPHCCSVPEQCFFFLFFFFMKWVLIGTEQECTQWIMSLTFTI